MYGVMGEKGVIDLKLIFIRVSCFHFATYSKNDSLKTAVV